MKIELSCGGNCTNPETLAQFAESRTQLENAAFNAGKTVVRGQVICKNLFKLPNSELFACPAHVRDSVIDKQNLMPADRDLKFISPSLVEGFQFVQPPEIHP